MQTAPSLRALGTAGLTQLLTDRPELLQPGPPRSLDQLAARLREPAVLIAAAHRWNLPTVQVCVALAALGARADRARLHDLLGIGAAPAEARDACGRALARLQADYLLEPGGSCLVPEAVEIWRGALGLAEDLRTLAAVRTADELRHVLRTHQESAPARKADALERVIAVLSDGARVRALAARAPAEFGTTLEQVAHGDTTVEYYGHWYSIRPLGPDEGRRQAIEWAMAHFLLVRRSWTPELVMPAEVALALRGPSWHAPFAPEPPPVTWTLHQAQEVAAAAEAAASTALRAITALLTDAGSRPVPRLKSGAVGVRELRRLATVVDLAPRHLRLLLDLVWHLGMLADSGDGLAPTDTFDRWQALPAAERYGQVVEAWLTLPTSPGDDGQSTWQPFGLGEAVAARPAVLQVLASAPRSVPESLDELTAAVRWRSPLALGPAETARATAEAVLDDAAWLGVTGAGALSAAGVAAVSAPSTGIALSVAGAVAGRLGEGRDHARFQADLTAVVLGDPSPRLAATLDLAADREARSTASVWRFSPDGVRRALDGGITADELLAALAAAAGDAGAEGLPQPLRYLVRDVERRHGTLRGGSVACYLRSQDEALLTEVVADRQLRALHLRRLAPTVVLSSRPLAETLRALRAAGHAPVEEAADGATIATTPRHHRAEPVHTRPGNAPRRTSRAGADLDAVARALLSTTQAASHRDLDEDLIDLFSQDDAVIDLRSDRR